jgi:hypothetical protein
MTVQQDIQRLKTELSQNMEIERNQLQQERLDLMKFMVQNLLQVTRLSKLRQELETLKMILTKLNQILNKKLKR